MRYRNPDNLPSELIAAAIQDSYDPGEADISITSLIDTPRRVRLRKEFGGQIEVDIGQRLWPLLGQSFHALMELGSDPDTVKEERLYADCRGWRISGAIDRQVTRRDKMVLQDYKVTTVSAPKYNKPKWIEQLNGYAWLYWKNRGVMPDGLEIIALFRDWREYEKRHRNVYPPQPIQRIKIPLWKPTSIEAFIENAVLRQQEAQGEMPECTDEERWGDVRRCERWCEFREHCDQYRDIIIDKTMDAAK